MATNYRIKIDIRYSSAANATSARTAINNALVGVGRAETAVINNSTDVYLVIVSLPSEAVANTIVNALRPAWSGYTRTYGKVSVVRTDATT